MGRNKHMDVRKIVNVLSLLGEEEMGAIFSFTTGWTNVNLLY